MNYIVVAVLVLAVLYLLCGNNAEGYSTIAPRPDNVGANNYYNLRAYGHDLYDYERLDRYPYNYQPHAYHGRFDYYTPNFHKYGYGHW